MNATSHDVHVDQLLSEIALDRRPEGFIASEICPVVTVGHRHDRIADFSKGRLRRQNTARAPGKPANSVTREVGSLDYYCHNYALAYDVTIEDKSNADPIFVSKLYEDGAVFITDMLLLDWEIRVATQVTSGSNVGSYSAVDSGWGGAGANPLADVWQAIDNVHYSRGIKPNKITFGVEAWDKFRRHSTVRNLIFGVNNGGGYPNTQQVADLLDVAKVQVGGAFEDEAEEGSDEENLSSIWGDNVLVAYCSETASKDRPSFMYSLRWVRPGLPNFQVERHPYNTVTKTERIEAGYYQDERIVGASYAFLLHAVNSSS